VLTRTELTAEGHVTYRARPAFHALIVPCRSIVRLVSRIRSTSTVLFFVQTPESITKQEYALQVLVLGIDDTVMQTVHATHTCYAHNLLWGSRLRDVISEAPEGDGSLPLDLRNFHLVDPSVPTSDFPYPRTSGAVRS
jgi:hypothetical protein